MLEIKLAVAKTNKYSVSESGDSVEVTERSRGGLSVVLADAQGSGRSARTNSRLVVAKCASLIGEGARDGAVARAVHDMLFALRDGKVSATLTIISADLETMSLVITQNAGPPVFLLQSDVVMTLDASSQPIGVHRSMKPNVCEVVLEPKLAVMAMTDGIYAAGRAQGIPWQDEEFQAMLLCHGASPEFLAQEILEASLRKGARRAQDDMAVCVLYVGEHSADVKIRTLSVNMPC
ncbi:MAG: Stage II sporulation protein E [Firmicutes bacterium]|nr:Stage II sporulation protein E [Bacillota bacterium]